MKNVLTQWELRRKTDPKLEPRGLLLLLDFLARAVGRWPAALLLGAAGPSHRRLSHRRSGPSEVKLSYFLLLVVNQSSAIHHRGPGRR